MVWLECAQLPVNSLGTSAEPRQCHPEFASFVILASLCTGTACEQTSLDLLGL